VFSNLCADADGSLLFLDFDEFDGESDSSFAPRWSLAAWGDEPLVYSSAIVHDSNQLLPRVVKAKDISSAGPFVWSDADVHVLFRYSNSLFASLDSDVWCSQPQSYHQLWARDV
jgi:hypothetical protein